jgi:hypothetical protein
MKNYIWLFAIVLFTTNLYAQKKETRKVGDFSYVSMGINADVTIKQGSKTELIIEGDEEDLEEIETTVSGDKLKIRNKSNSSWWGNNHSKVKIYITLKEFSGASVSGSGEVVSSGVLKGGNIDLGVSGSGDLELDLEVLDVDCGISGSGSIYLKGKGKTSSLSISGSGKLDAADFEVETIGIRISGSGSAYVNVSKEIDSRISGSGTIRYKGDPDKVSNHSSGSGSLKKM